MSSTYFPIAVGSALRAVDLAEGVTVLGYSLDTVPGGSWRRPLLQLEIAGPAETAVRALNADPAGPWASVDSEGTYTVPSGPIDVRILATEHGALPAVWGHSGALDIAHVYADSDWCRAVAVRVLGATGAHRPLVQITLTMSEHLAESGDGEAWALDVLTRWDSGARGDGDALLAWIGDALVIVAVTTEGGDR